MLAEEVYLLDNMTYIEAESFISLFSLSTTGKPGLSIPGGTKRLVARNKSAEELP